MKFYIGRVVLTIVVLAIIQVMGFVMHQVLVPEVGAELAVGI